jgi:hypothetical protein
VDNAYQHIAFDPPLKVHHRRRLAMTLIADGDAGNAITWWITPGWQLKGSQLYLNGQQIPGTGDLRVHYGKRTGIIGGRLMRREAWQRVTVFLGPVGTTMLVLGWVLMLGALLVALYVPPDDERE